MMHETKKKFKKPKERVSKIIRKQAQSHNMKDTPFISMELKTTLYQQSSCSLSEQVFKLHDIFLLDESFSNEGKSYKLY